MYETGRSLVQRIPTYRVFVIDCDELHQKNTLNLKLVGKGIENKNERKKRR